MPFLLVIMLHVLCIMSGSPLHSSLKKCYRNQIWTLTGPFQHFNRLLISLLNLIVIMWLYCIVRSIPDNIRSKRQQSFTWIHVTIPCVIQNSCCMLSYAKSAALALKIPQVLGLSWCQSWSYTCLIGERLGNSGGHITLCCLGPWITTIPHTMMPGEMLVCSCTQWSSNIKQN